MPRTSQQLATTRVALLFLVFPLYLQQQTMATWATAKNVSTADDNDSGIIVSWFSIAPAVVSSTANDGNMGDCKTASTANDSDGGIIVSGFSTAPAAAPSTADDGNMGDRKTVSTTNDSDGGIIVSGFSIAPAVVSSTAEMAI